MRKAKAKVPAPPTTIVQTQYGPVDTAKVNDQDYQTAIQIGLTALITQDRLNYEDVKP